jgi:hypothetical protein
MAEGRTSILTPVVFAIPLVALAITSPTARALAGCCLALLTASTVLFFCLFGLKYFWPAPAGLSAAAAVETNLRQCGKRAAGKPPAAAIECYRLANSALDGECRRLDGIILAMLKDGPTGKAGYLKSDGDWQAHLNRTVAVAAQKEQFNPIKDLIVEQKRYQLLRARVDSLEKMASGK